jgi:hypothetical protein
MRKTALAAGLFYIATFVFSIPALGFYKDVLDDDKQFVLGAGNETAVLWGGLFEVLTALTGIGTAVVLYRVLRRDSQSAAIGFVASRTLEAAMIFVGVVSLLSVVTMRQDYGAADASTVLPISQALVAVHNWTFLLGPGVMPAVNALCFATVMYRTRLVPRIIPTLGLIGAPLLLVSSTASLFGVHEQVSSTAMLMALPIAAWEFSVGVYMTVKGFKPQPLAELPVTIEAAPQLAYAN